MAIPIYHMVNETTVLEEMTSQVLFLNLRPKYLQETEEKAFLTMLL